MADGSEFNFLMKCSHFENYNNTIIDLLEPSPMTLNVREDLKKGVYVEGLKEEVVTQFQEIYLLIMRGIKNRHIGLTAKNRESSRSHSFLTVSIET